MARYIDADEFEYVILNEDIEVNHKCTDLENYVNGANQFRHQMKNAIRKQPTADVVEVKHGEWEQYGLRNPQCTICHKYNIEESNFCPNCGAKMDGRSDV